MSGGPAPVLETERLSLHRFGLDDAPFVLELLNQPSFLRFIGDKGVRSLDDARAYLADGPQASYARHGYGLWLVRRKRDGAPLGMCGLLKRDALPDPDLGFAFVPRAWGKGYAFEAAAATLAHGHEVLSLGAIVAVTSPDNLRSIRLLEKLGLRDAGPVELAPGEPACRLYGRPGRAEARP